MISFGEAQAVVLGHARALPSESRLLMEARNHFTAQDMLAPFPIPRFDHSAVDGYAIISSDAAAADVAATVTLNVIGTVKTGDTANLPVKSGCAIRVFTGAMLPVGADTVVMVEDVVYADGTIRLSGLAKPNKNIRRAGEEFSINSVCLPKSTKLTPAAIGLAATLGTQVIEVHCKPRVALIITGSELVAPGMPLGDAQIFDSNRFALIAALKDIGIDDVQVFAAKDDSQELQVCLEQAKRNADVIISSGGASVGDVDFVKPVLRTLGAKILFDKVSIKPGKPTVFATWPDKLMFGLPGNPVAALVTFLLFVKPAILRMSGSLDESNKMFLAELDGTLTKRTPRTEFVRAKTALKHNANVVTPCIGQESHMLGGLVHADSLIIFDGEPRTLTDRSEVKVIRILWT